MHKSHDFLLTCENFVLLQVRLKIFIRYETIAVSIHVSKSLIEAWFALKSLVFYLDKQTLQAFEAIVVQISLANYS